MAAHAVAFHAAEPVDDVGENVIRQFDAGKDRRFGFVKKSAIVGRQANGVVALGNAFEQSCGLHLRRRDFELILASARTIQQAVPFFRFNNAGAFFILFI